MAEGFDLSSTYVHLGADAGAVPLPDFSWAPEAMAAYGERFAVDGDAGRLVCILRQDASWDTWERHPAGEELVVVLDGHIELVQDLHGREHRVELRAREAAVNPRGVWHTADVRVPGHALFVTAGRGTEVRPR
jgi:hypothetical protein